MPKTQKTSLVVLWLRLQASKAGGTGSIPGQGTMSLHAVGLDPPPKKKPNLSSPKNPQKEDRWG